MRLKISCVSDVGRVRDNNEDMACAGMYLIRDGSLNIEKEVFGNESFCLLVSDGMGGHENGEYASQFTLETLRAFLLDKSQEHGDPAHDLKARIGFVSLCLNLWLTDGNLDAELQAAEAALDALKPEAPLPPLQKRPWLRQDVPGQAQWQTLVERVTALAFQAHTPKVVLSRESVLTGQHGPCL